ncbi:hypothetical protein LMG26411_03164 [Cupriavidus numazuensis]|uniref:Tyr recombinase domain-containing protein n=1 Tax=Cupriavidus numazuensis TaxID=221992 RepID=A0ABN7Q1W9_9BURK|nr:hypothetical protein LMG26411_03164 [Cupriavidus numazuensis]
MSLRKNFLASSKADGIDMWPSEIPDLSFRNITFSSTAAPWNLLPLLFRGGACIDARKVSTLITSGKLGQPIETRIPLVRKLHETITSRLSAGGSYYTAKGTISTLRTFYAWLDENGLSPTVESISDQFQQWTEHQLDRLRTTKCINRLTIYAKANRLGALLDEALDTETRLVDTTRIRNTCVKRRPIGLQSEKQPLDSTLLFGQTLIDIINALPTSTIRGPLPVIISLRTGQSLEEWSRLRPTSSLKSQSEAANSRDRQTSIEKRAAYETDTSARTRHPLMNLRIEAEMLLFISQTGMNLSQAYRIQCGKFSYQSYFDGYQVRRIYKQRKHGEVEFQIYSEYRPIFDRYLSWRADMFPNDPEGRLFPLNSPQRRSPDVAPFFSAVRKRCARLGVAFIGPRILRHTRVNWLMRYSNDRELTAEMAQHTQETLLQNYLRPHHQLAVAEITRFHSSDESHLMPPGPGSCARAEAKPNRDAPKEAPRPDCVSPAGCLFCVHHRDIDSSDHMWSLATYRHLKTLELAGSRFSKSPQGLHPTAAVVERLSAKLENLRISGSERALWIEEALARVAEGSYHPKWHGFIELYEARI